MIRALSVLPLVILLIPGSKGIRDYVMLNSAREGKANFMEDSGHAHETFWQRCVSLQQGYVAVSLLLLPKSLCFMHL